VPYLYLAGDISSLLIRERNGDMDDNLDDLSLKPRTIRGESLLDPYRAPYCVVRAQTRNSERISLVYVVRDVIHVVAAVLRAD